MKERERRTEGAAGREKEKARGNKREYKGNEGKGKEDRCGRTRRGRQKR